MDIQTHIMLLKITIHKIQLSVRFPCSLTFQLKIENKSIDCRGSYELVKGMATPEETLRLEAQLEKKDDGTYRDKQAKIVIYMTSANGKIPAGSASLSLGSVRVGSSDNVKIPIDKCPDKQANINFTYTLEFLRNAPRLGSHGKTSSYGRLQQSSVSSSSRIRYGSGSPQYDNIRGSGNDKYSKFSVQRKSSNNSGSYINNNSYSALNYQIQPRNISPDRQFVDIDEKRMSRVSGEQQQEYMTRTLGNQKIKTERPRDISKLQRQNSSRKQLELQQQSDQHINRIRNQLTQVSNQNQLLKEKIRNYQRREKQQNLVVKDLKDELQRKKQKNYQQEFIRMESQSILDEKQKLLKQMQTQMKLYEQQISDLKMNAATQNKRIQFKQASLKDQLAKLNQKYQQSELERQRAIVDLNSMLEQLENTQKKNQLAIKQKDKVQAQEKNKLVKKSQTLSRTIDQQKDIIDEKMTQISDLQRQIKLMQSKLADLHSEGSQLNMKSKNLAYDLEKERQINKNYAKQIENYQVIEKQLIELRKKYQQLQIQDQSSKKSLQNATKLNQSLQSKIKQLEQQMVSKSQQISALMTKSFNLTSQIEAFKKQQENYNREAETLSLNNLSAANKIQEMRRQLDQIQLAKNELQMQSEQQIAYMIKSKQYLESELEQAKWNAQKYKDNCEEMITKNKSLNADILQLNRRILQLDDRSARLEQQLVDAKSTIASNIHQKQLQSIKQKDLQDKLKQKNDEIYELNKKISKMERQNFMLTQKQKHTQKFYADKLETQQGTSKTKQTKYNEALQNINKLQLELMARDEKITLLQSTQTKILNESEYLKDQIKNLKKQNEDKQQNLLSLNEENLALSDKLTLTAQNLQKQTIAKNQTIQNLSKKSKQFDEYKAANNAALQQLFQQIAKDLNANSSTSQLTLLSFPDANLTPLQVQAMKKRNNIIVKYQQTIRGLEINLKNLDQELNKAKKIHITRQEQLEALLENQKSKFKGVQSDLSLEKQQLLQKISDLEDKVFQLTADNEKLNIQNEENRINSNDQENHIHELNFEVENYKNQIKILQQNIKNLKQENIKTKTAFENSLQSTTEQNSVQVDKLRKTIVENEKKINTLDKIITQKEEIISRLENSLENILLQKQKTQQKLIQTTNRLNEVTLDRKNGLDNQKSYQRTIRKLQQTIILLQSQIQATNKKVNESQIQKKKLQDLLAQEQIMKTKLTGQLELANEHIRQLEDMLKNTDDKSKKSYQKNVQEIKKLKQQIISLNSTVELKTFEITQHQATIKMLKSANQDIGQQSASRREQLLSLQSSLQQSKNNYILVAQQLQNALTQKQSLQNQLKSVKQAMFNLQQMLNENQTNLQSMTLKQRQIARLKQQISLKDRNYDKTLQDNKGQNAELKKQIATRVQREEDYKKRVRELQSYIQNQRYDIETEKKGWEQTADTQRKKLMYELEGVKDENKLLAEQFQFQREQMNHQLDQAAQQIAHLKQIIHESQYQIQNSSSQNFQQLEKIKSLEMQLKNCKEQWQKEKLIYVPTQKQLKQIESEISRYQKYALQLQKKNKQLTEVAKKRLAEDQVVSNSDLLRQINTILLRNKSKILSRVGQREREQVIADFKQIHEKLEGAIKSYHLLK